MQGNNMNVSITASKRTYHEAGNPPKKIKPEEINNSPFDNEHLFTTILSRFTISDLGNFASVSKKANELVQTAFTWKARELGFELQVGTQAAMKIQKIYLQVRTL